MTWTRLPDNFTDRPEMLMISRSARLLHCEALVWCNRHGTDGLIPGPALPRITDANNIGDLVDELASVRLWTASPVPQCWQLDWSEQEPAAEVSARREYRSATQKRYRERKSRHARGDHEMCDVRFCRAAVTSNAIGNGGSNESSHETPSRPVPSRPRGRDRDRTARSVAAGAAPTGSQGTEAAHTFAAGEDGRCTFAWGGIGGSVQVVCGERAKAAAHTRSSTKRARA